MEQQKFDTRAIQQLDSAHFLHPFTDHNALKAQGARVIVRGAKSTSLPSAK